jgi:glucose/arabinose dehydrogenase
MPNHPLRTIFAAFLITGCSSTSTVTAPPVGPEPAETVSVVRVAGTVAVGLDVPWGMAFLPDGSALVSERDTGKIVRVTEGASTSVGTVAGAQPRGEGGLLGIARIGDWVYAYFTAATDNRVIRMKWDGQTLGKPESVLTGIPKAGIHNGGRMTVGPDGMLYVATGDAGERGLAQDLTSLGGKILRITPTGATPADNPFDGSPVLSLGHRNVQGLAFDARNRLWAGEFGQSDVDELNLVKPGLNYGWPACEGACQRKGFVDPVVQWKPTAIASPSGLAIVGDNAYVASLRGQSVWQVPLDESGKATELDLGDLGRLRTIELAPDGSMWLSTSNTDGRGDPRDGDDRIVRLTVG